MTVFIDGSPVRSHTISGGYEEVRFTGPEDGYRYYVIRTDRAPRWVDRDMIPVRPDMAAELDAAFPWPWETT